MTRKSDSSFFCAIGNSLEFPITQKGTFFVCLQKIEASAAERLTNEVKKDILENENYIHYKMKGIVGGIYLK